MNANFTISPFKMSDHYILKFDFCLLSIYCQGKIGESLEHITCFHSSVLKAPHNALLSNDLKCCFKLSRVHLKHSKLPLGYRFGHSKESYY